MKIVLLGFQGNGAHGVDLGASALHDLVILSFFLSFFLSFVLFFSFFFPMLLVFSVKLLKLLPSHQPVIRGLGRNEVAGVKYQMEYEVVHFGLDSLLELETNLRKNLKSVDSKAGFSTLPP